MGCDTRFFHSWFPGMLLVLVLLGGCQLWPFHEEEASRDSAPPVVQPSAAATIVFEEPNLPQPHEAALTPEKSTPPCGTKSGAGTSRPRVAIIIDDMGYHQQIGKHLLALDMPLTFSFLPKAPFTLELEEQAWQEGRDILLHMPMEARDSAWDPGPGALYLRDSSRAIRKKVEENILAVPHAIGSNNHMGSRFTENRAAMHTVLGVLQEHHFFFVDSYTTAQSTGLDEARTMGIPTARRHVFLDNVHERKKICLQLQRLVELARKKGWAIGIGHPNQATLQALTQCQKQLLSQVDIVPVHTLVQ